MAGGISGLAIWALVATVTLYGFYVGDVAQSQSEVRDHFDSEREVATTGGADGRAPPRTAQAVAVAGLDLSERLAVWANRTDGTLLGDSIECLALLAVSIKPLRELAAIGQEVTAA